MNKVEPPSQTLQQLQQISHQLDQLNSQFNQFQHDRQPKKERKEQLTLAPGGWTFSSYGYKRFGLYVASAQTITVSYAGITYALNLAAGLNVLQPLDETRITSATPFIAQAIWSDSIDFGTMIDQSANVSVINTPNVSATLTGSNVVNGGQVKSTLYNSSGQELMAANFFADGSGVTFNMLATIGYGYQFNGASWDRVRNNTQSILLASSTRTADVQSTNLDSFNARGLIIDINVTAISGTNPTLTLSLDKQDPVTLAIYPYVSGLTAITAIGHYRFVLYPSALTTLAQSIGTSQLPIPKKFAAYFSVGGTTPSVTFSAGYDLIL